MKIRTAATAGSLGQTRPTRAMTSALHDRPRAADRHAPDLLLVLVSVIDHVLVNTVLRLRSLA
jgi:hypothetical protein